MAGRDRWHEGAEPQGAASEEAAAESARQQTEERRSFARRVQVLVFLFLIFGVLVIAQLILSQVVGLFMRQDRVEAQVTDNSRGRIVDSTGLLLAMDGFTWELWVNPTDYRRAEAKPEEMTDYAARLGVTAADLLNAAEQPGLSALVTKNIPEEQCRLANDKKQMPWWIWCDGKRKRIYLHGQLAAHALGFVDPDQKGSAGIELTYNDYLSSSGNWPTSKLPGRPQPLPVGWDADLPSPNGRDLVLHLNAPLQYMVEKRLDEAVRTYQAKDGVILVMNPKTGAILALAGWPPYDPNRYAEFTQGEWGNSAVSVAYEPGSIFKPITYAAGIDAGKLTPDDRFNDKGKLLVDGKPIENAQKRAYGQVTATQALANSINVVTADICLNMGAETFYRYVRQFHFGQYTEIDAGPENAGIVKWPGTKYASRFDQAANSFGQGITVTPVQMANAISAIANGGLVMQPQLVKALVYDGQMYTVEPRMLGRAIKPETAHTLTQMLVYTVENYEHGKNLVPGFRVAGKTGTAEIPEKEGYTSKLTITSFVGFLPAADPELLILVKLSEPKKSRWAEAVTLPVFGQVAQDAVNALKLQPDNRMP
jgi:cell division protein FtsI/penicillin-binding protein 2